MKLFSKTKVPPENPVVNSYTEKIKPTTVVPVVVNRLEVTVAIKFARVLIQLFLRVDKAQDASVAPPLW
jgi:hypothetical protein